jgi:hypothetical protein
VLAGASRSLAGGIFRRLALVPDACSWASLRLDWASLRLGWTSLRLDERGSLEQTRRIFLRLRCINERRPSRRARSGATLHASLTGEEFEAMLDRTVGKSIDAGDRARMNGILALMPAKASHAHQFC